MFKDINCYDLYEVHHACAVRGSLYTTAFWPKLLAIITYTLVIQDTPIQECCFKA